VEFGLLVDGGLAGVQGLDAVELKVEQGLHGGMEGGSRRP
jgi:hypothetical protein